MTKIPWFDSQSSLTTSAFETLYKKFALPLTKFIVKRVGGNQDMVDEVFSRTVAAAWQGFGAFKNKSSYFTWLCKIALNKIADYYREQINYESRFVAPLLEEIANYDSRQLTPEEWYVLNELCNSVKGCVKLLPKEKQQLIYLRYWKDMTVRQISKSFGVSERTIEGKLYRARKMLDDIISNEHPEIVPEYFKKEK